MVHSKRSGLLEPVDEVPEVRAVVACRAAAVVVAVVVENHEDWMCGVVVEGLGAG